MDHTTPGQRTAPWVALATLLLAGAASPQPATAADPGPAETRPAPAASLEQDIQSSKQKALALDRDLTRLEHELLFPATTRFGVFVALEQGERQDDAGPLRSVRLKVDDKVIANHIYTGEELAALRAGGVQQAFAGNLAPGKHRLTASVITGAADHARHAETTIAFEKTTGPQYIELSIDPAPGASHPRLRVQVRN